MEQFKKFALSNEQKKAITGGGACQNLANCYASRDGACIYSNDYAQCMSNQAQACDATFLIPCAME